MKRILAVALMCGFAAHGWGQQAPATSADEQFKAIYTADAAWRRAQRGESDDDSSERILPQLPKVDAAAQAAKMAHWRDVLQQMDALKFDDLPVAGKLNFRVLRGQLVVMVDDQKFRDYEMPVNSDTAFWSEEERASDGPFKTEQDYANYIAQLNDLPRYFREQMANMRAGLARGFTPPQVTLRGRDTTLRGVAMESDPQRLAYYKPFLTLPGDMPAETQMKLRQEAAAALPGIIAVYKELYRFFSEEYVPHARTSLAAEALPDGKDYYQAKIREFTTTELTPVEIHQIGLSEMAKIHAEMLAAMQQSGFKGDLPAFLHFLRTDPQFYAKTPEELLMRAAFIAKEFDGVSGRYFGYLPRQRFAIKPVPTEIAPFYTSARGGPSVYWVNTYDLPSRALYSLPSLTLHESAPGHSLQLSIAQEHKDLPKFRNAYISAYGEGWALYCERLGTEMGMYHTPYETFGMLSYQAWRAARLVVDTGIHSQNWTREQAQAYLHDNTALSDHEIETEVDRYISWPAQALSYYLGELAILKARHKAEAALGSKFNLRAFHDAVLELGAVPLPILEEHIDEFIAKSGVGPYPEMEK